MTKTLIGSYKDYNIYKDVQVNGKRGWLAESEKYLQKFGDNSEAPDDKIMNTVRRTLDEVYMKQGVNGYETLKEKKAHISQ